MEKRGKAVRDSSEGKAPALKGRSVGGKGLPTEKILDQKTAEKKKP